jgi:hypothetical protein
MGFVKVTIRHQDEAVWERAREVAESEYLPFSRFLTKVLAKHLEDLDQRPNGQEKR